jgi:GST-like protein
MLKLFTWTTPNGIKPLIMLEELGLPYETCWVNIGKGEQHTPDFLQVNPNGKIPALLDDGLAVFESGAILMHLAEKSGRFLAPSGPARTQALEWLFFQVGGVGPMFGQLGHFRTAHQKVGYALERYQKESERLYGVLDARLASVDYLAGQYGIADMATWGWAARHEALGISLTGYHNVARWLKQVGERPAVQRAAARNP